MAVKKKNKALPLICLLVLAGLLAGAYFYLQKLDLNAEKTDEDEASEITVQSYAADDVKGITFNSSDGMAELSFTRLGTYEWQYDGETDFPLDSSKLEQSVANCLTLLATRELPEENEDFGFGTPKNHITFRLSTEADGEFVREYTVGNTNSFNSGTYVRDDTNKKIYLLSSDMSAGFNVSLSDLILLDTNIDSVDATSTSSVLIKNGDSHVEITDTSGIEEFMPKTFSLINCDDFAEYNVTDEKFKEYGIDKSASDKYITVNYKTTVTSTNEAGETSSVREDAVFNVWFGSTDDDGNVYYTVTDSTILYKLTKDSFDQIMGWLTYVPAPETETTVTTELLPE